MNHGRAGERGLMRSGGRTKTQAKSVKRGYFAPSAGYRQQVPIPERSTYALASVDVNRPIDMVYHQWTQFESFPDFMEGVARIDQLDDTHLHWVIKVGRAWHPRIRRHRHRAASRGAGRLEVRQRPRPRRSGDLPPARRRVHPCHDSDGHRPRGLVENVADKLDILTARVSGDLQRFKDFSENIPTETGAWRGDVSRPDA